MYLSSKMVTRWREFDYLSLQQCKGDPNLSAHMMRHRLLNAKSLYRKDLFAHYGCVNAIEFSNNGEWLVSGGDDRRVLVWNVEKAISGTGYPTGMRGEHNSNIFCLGFDSCNSKLFSAGNDEQVVVHDVETKKTLDVFLHEEAVYGLSVDPLNDNVFASACDDGRILIWDIREHASSDPFTLAGYSSAFHAVMYNPAEPRLVATANSKEGVGLWDVRKPNICVLKYGGCLSTQSSMSVRFNSSGTSLLALRRRLPPVLYSIASPYPVAEFDHPGYYNSCTMKSCCFAGDADQYVLSGSDDFKLYMWKIPEENKGIWVNEAHLVLKGHRSIVNQVRYNQVNTVLVSSGVEKVVKLWSIFPLPGGTGFLNSVKDGMRRVYTPEEYINLVLESGQLMTHDYSHKSVLEDPRMMAFFDSLVQRDIEGWTTDSDDSGTNSDRQSMTFEVQSDASVSSLPTFPSSSSGEDSMQESPKSSGSLSPQTRSYIYALTSRVEANLHNLQNDGNGSNSNKEDSKTSISTNSDRISELIAQKRHEQLLRVVKTTLKLTKKRLRRKKLSERTDNNNTTLDSDHELRSLNSARKILNSVLHCQNNLQNGKDRRKILQRKRSKIMHQSLYTEPSSDSDDNADNQRLNFVNKSKLNNKDTSRASSSVSFQQENAANSNVNGTTINSVNIIQTTQTIENGELTPNNIIVSKVITNSSHEEQLQDTSNQNHSNDTETTSSAWTFKRLKNSKSLKRNYRTRDNSDDLQEN